MQGKVNTAQLRQNSKPITQSSLPVFEELLSKSAKLETDLLSFTAVFTSFLDSVQKVRDTAVNTQSNGESAL